MSTPSVFPSRVIKRQVPGPNEEGAESDGRRRQVRSGLAHGPGTCHFVFRKAVQCAPLTRSSPWLNSYGHAGSQRFTDRPVIVSGAFRGLRHDGLDGRVNALVGVGDEETRWPAANPDGAARLLLREEP